MAKVIHRGLAKPDDPIFSTGPEISSNHAYRGSSRNSASATTGETQASRASASGPKSRWRKVLDSRPDPKDYATDREYLDADDRWLEENQSEIEAAKKLAPIKGSDLL